MRRIVLSVKPDIIEFEVEAPNVASNCLAGHFVIVRARENAERIPLTIADYSRERKTI